MVWWTAWQSWIDEIVHTLIRTSPVLRIVNNVSDENVVEWRGAKIVEIDTSTSRELLCTDWNVSSAFDQTKLFGCCLFARVVKRICLSEVSLAKGGILFLCSQSLEKYIFCDLYSISIQFVHYVRKYFCDFFVNMHCCKCVKNVGWFT